MNFEPDKNLQKIISDNKSGSAELLANLNNYLLDNLDQINFNQLLPFLKNQFIEFAAIQNYLTQLSSLNLDDEQKIQSYLNNFSKSSLISIQKIFDNSFEEIKNHKKIITISNSKTVLEYFKLLSERVKDISVIVCESRPIFEGRILAEELSKNYIDVKLITEAMIANEIKNVDAAIIGADSILNNGNIINKVGSKLLAIACKNYNKPFFVLANKTKYTSRNSLTERQKSSNEIWDYKSDKIKINNYYFEVIESELITKIYSD